jgi:hypothetical protein
MGRESRLALLVAESVAVTTATTPLLRALPLIPDARQTKAPEPELQLSAAPAAVRAGPATALSEVMLAGEYVSTH